MVKHLWSKVADLPSPSGPWAAPWLGRSLLVLLLLLAGCESEPEGTKACPPEKTRCDGICVDVNNDPDHCGACGHRCGTDDQCLDGACRETAECEPGFYACGGECVDPWSDPDNCGACANACADDEVCSKGQCGSSCADELVPCGRACVETWDDPKNCGSCGNACEPGQTCKEGVCTCAEGLTSCGGGCVDLLNDESHCGACDALCAGPHALSGSCVDGACVLFCEPDRLDCDGDVENGCEVDTRQDSENCGECGRICSEDFVCVDGDCACPAGTTDCFGTCVDLESDLANCGTCGRDCTDLANVFSATCEEGLCELTCVSGWAACGEAADGCTTYVDANPDHCGTCGNACIGAEYCLQSECLCPNDALDCEGICTAITVDVAHCGACGNDCREHPNVQSASCVASTCVPTCEPGFGDCDPEAPGCETNTSTDPDHCSGCGIACRPDQICAGGSCVCPPDHKECNGQCRPILVDMENCGDCGQSCIDQPNALSAQCVDGGCVFACQDDYADCDPTKAGCETHLPSDLAHCGACTNACRPNEACLDGDCVCPAELANCDSACTDIEVDPSHCGACEHACDPGQVCEEFTCYEPCPGNERHCGGVCFDLQRSIEHCGRCGVNCGELPHVLSASCHQGGCRFGCQTGWGDCNEEPADGCETDLSITDAHCGACGSACEPDQHCADAKCACNDESSTNCEGSCVDTSSDPKNCASCGNECGIHCEGGSCLDVAFAPPSQGSTHSCVIDSEGALYCWGRNETGQIGNGEAGDPVLRPTRVPLPSPAAEVALGLPFSTGGLNHAFTCARMVENGEVYCWGTNQSRNITDTTTAFHPTPMKIYRTKGTNSPLQGTTAIAVSYRTACVVLEDEGKVMCWGYNSNGEMGDSTKTRSTLPKYARDPDDPEDANKMLKNIKRIAGGENHFCAVSHAGDVFCWGDNAYGRTGLGTNSGDTLVPTKVAMPGQAVNIQVRNEYSCALLDDGQIACWGRNFYGQFGDGSGTTAYTPVLVPNLSGAIGLMTAYSHACAWFPNGQAKCWGSNQMGQLGDGNKGGLKHLPTDVLLDGAPMTDITSVSGLNDATCVMRKNKLYQCWGRNDYGKLGTGDTNEVPTPTSPLW